MLTVGTQLGSYRILCPLDKQTSGEVYRVKHIESERELALKVLSAPNVCDDQGFKLLKQQAIELALLSHKNILSIDEIGIENNICYTVSELIEGQTLQSRLSESPLHWKKAIVWTITIAEALAAAHSSGMVHGNLNPRNIYLTSDECIKILDFGLARFITPRVGCIMNSVPYLSPQVAGDDADIRSDIFALGCILYEMISGRSAFARPSVFETVSAVLKKEPQKLSELKKDVPLELDDIISHCLDKKPGVRYPSARDLIFELRQVLDCLGEGSALPRSRHFAAAFAAIVILIILIYLKLFNHT
jgi:eukaryotic-like serine/threonine-protein kinase